MPHPRCELSNRRRRFAHRNTTASQQQLGDRLQIQHVSLHPPPTHHPPLLADMRRVQLHHLPTRPHRRRRQRPVIMARSLHPHPDQASRQHSPRLGDHLSQSRSSHRENDRAQQPTPLRIANQRRRRPLAHIHRYHRNRRSERNTRRHNPTSRGVRRTGASTPDPQGIGWIPSDTSGGECEEEQLRSYQLLRVNRDWAPHRSGPARRPRRAAWSWFVGRRG
jgi:hypothetical protein